MNEKINSLLASLRKSILGAETPSKLLLTSLISNGHVLIQGAPGLGKTSLAKKLAEVIDCSFGRIQFTPDLLPSDILGYSIYNQKDHS